MTEHKKKFELNPEQQERLSQAVQGGAVLTPQLLAYIVAADAAVEAPVVAAPLAPTSQMRTSSGRGRLVTDPAKKPAHDPLGSPEISAPDSNIAERKVISLTPINGNLLI